MAFIRTEKKKSGTYLRLVKNFRDKDGRTRQKTLKSLGKLEDYPIQDLKQIAQTFYRLAGGTMQELDLYRPKELGRYNYGYSHVLRMMLQKYGLTQLLNKISNKNKKKLDMLSTVILLLAQRLAHPGSKYALFQQQRDYLGIGKQIPLHHLYRCLDHLETNNRAIRHTIYQAGKQAFGMELDVVFYDVTTFYFDSEKEDRDTLRRKGFSKDGKIGKTQVIFGLLIDKNKQPIDYIICPGNQYEGHTLVQVLEKLKQRYTLNKMVVVADTGMMNRENLAYLTADTQSYGYIIGERLKSLPAKVKQELTNLANYRASFQITNNREKVLKIRYFTYKYGDKQLICTYSQNRARKDRFKREEKLIQAAKLLKTPSLIERKASRFFLKKTGSNHYELDQARLEEAARYDGFLCIATNQQSIPAKELVDHYKHLYQIEQTFRSFKSYLETRPMFHWTPKRIRGHLCLCYVSYSILIGLQNILAEQGHPMSEGAIRRGLNQMEVSLVEQNKKAYYLSSNLNESSSLLLKALGLSELPDIFYKQNLKDYLMLDKELG